MGVQPKVPHECIKQKIRGRAALERPETPSPIRRMNLREEERQRRRQQIEKHKSDRKLQADLEEARIKEEADLFIIEEKERLRQEKIRIKKEEMERKNTENLRKNYYKEIDAISFQVRQTRLKQLGLLGLGLLLKERRDLCTLAQEFYESSTKMFLLRQWKNYTQWNKIQQAAMEVGQFQKATQLYQSRLKSRIFRSLNLWKEIQKEEGRLCRETILWSKVKQGLKVWNNISVASYELDERKIDKMTRRRTLKNSFEVFRQGIAVQKKEKNTITLANELYEMMLSLDDEHLYENNRENINPSSTWTYRMPSVEEILSGNSANPRISIGVNHKEDSTRAGDSLSRLDVSGMPSFSTLYRPSIELSIDHQLLSIQELSFYEEEFEMEIPSSSSKFLLLPGEEN